METSECATAIRSGITQTSVEKRFIEQVLSKDFLFATMRPKVRLELTAFFEKFELDTGDIVYDEGLPGENYYIVGNGAVELRAGTIVLKTAAKGTIFGEVALFDKAPRS